MKQDSDIRTAIDIIETEFENVPEPDEFLDEMKEGLDEEKHGIVVFLKALYDEGDDLTLEGKTLTRTQKLTFVERIKAFLFGKVRVPDGAQAYLGTLFGIAWQQEDIIKRLEEEVGGDAAN